MSLKSYIPFAERKVSKHEHIYIFTTLKFWKHYEKLWNIHSRSEPEHRGTGFCESKAMPCFVCLHGLDAAHFERDATLIPAIHNRIDKLAHIMRNIVGSEQLVSIGSLRSRLSCVIQEMGGIMEMWNFMLVTEELTTKLETMSTELVSYNDHPKDEYFEEIKVYLYQKPR